MSLHSDKLVEIRKEITNKMKEINELNHEQEDLWKKIITDFNSNKARYRKMEGLSGLIQATDFGSSGEKLIVQFDKNSNPSAKALAQIEEDTGLTFKGMLDSKYLFGLNK